MIIHPDLSLQLLVYPSALKNVSLPFALLHCPLHSYKKKTNSFNLLPHIYLCSSLLMHFYISLTVFLVSSPIVSPPGHWFLPVIITTPDTREISVVNVH